MIVFDLDDTLTDEYLFWRSGVTAAARMLAERFSLPFPDIANDAITAPDAFERLADRAAVDTSERKTLIAEMVQIYRTHTPHITLRPDAAIALPRLADSHRLAIVTDGRSVTQRNKIAALGIRHLFHPDAIIISEEIGAEKLSGLPFSTLMQRFPNEQQWMYVADNPAKDFLAPNRLGWTTVMVEDPGHNIHPQVLPTDPAYHPALTVKLLTDIPL